MTNCASMELMNIDAPDSLLSAPVLRAALGKSYASGIEISDGSNWSPWNPEARVFNIVSPNPVVGDGMSFQRPYESPWDCAPRVFNIMSAVGRGICVQPDYESPWRAAPRAFNSVSALPVVRTEIGCQPASKWEIISASLVDGNHSIDSNQWRIIRAPLVEIIPGPLVDGNHRWAAFQTGKLGAIGEHSSALKGQLSALKRVNWQASTWLDSDDAESQTDSHWDREYYDFRNDLAASGVSLSAERLQITERWLAFDAGIAVKLLALYSEPVAVLCQAAVQGALSLFAKAKTWLRRELRRPYQCGNLISSQRRWYLHHGSHPSGLSPLAA